MRSRSARRCALLSLALAGTTLSTNAGISSSTEVTTMVSVDDYGSSLPGDWGMGRSVPSGNGRFVAFPSSDERPMLHDRELGTTKDLSSGPNGQRYWAWDLSLSRDGSKLAFGDRSVWVWDSSNSSYTDLTQGANNRSLDPTISLDGRYVAFTSAADNLGPPDTIKCGGYISCDDIYLQDLVTGQKSLASVTPSGAQANASSFWPSLSADGRYVAFSSNATNLIAGDTNSMADVFVRDRANGTTIRVSVSSSGLQADSGSGPPSISGDGRYVVFQSDATNLTPGPVPTCSYVDSEYGTTYYRCREVYLHDTLTGQTQLLSIDAAGNKATGDSLHPTISEDGSVIVFNSTASLVEGVPAGINRAYRWSRSTGTITLASVTTSGVPANGPVDSSFVSADGSTVAFVARASNLGGDIYNGSTFVRGPDVARPRQPRITAPLGEYILRSRSTLMTGFADAGDTVQILRSGVVLGQTMAAANRTWSVKVTLPSDGPNIVTSRSVSVLGQSSESDPVTLTVDTQASTHIAPYTGTSFVRTLCPDRTGLSTINAKNAPDAATGRILNDLDIREGAFAGQIVNGCTGVGAASGFISSSIQHQIDATGPGAYKVRLTIDLDNVTATASSSGNLSPLQAAVSYLSGKTVFTYLPCTATGCNATSAASETFTKTYALANHRVPYGGGPLVVEGTITTNSVWRGKVSIVTTLISNVTVNGQGQAVGLISGTIRSIELIPL